MREQYVGLQLTVPTEDDCARDAWLREQAARQEAEDARGEQARVHVIVLHDTEDVVEQGVIVFDP